MKFTKTYNIQPNSKQREAMTKAFKILTVDALQNGENVEVKTSDFYKDGSLLAELVINGKTQESRKVGVNGGLTVI